MRLDWFSRRLGAAMVLVLGCAAPLAAQERVARRQTEPLDGQATAQESAEITALRGEVQALRRDVNRLTELLIARSARPQAEERAKPTKNAAAVEDKQQPLRKGDLFVVMYKVADLVAPPIRKMVAINASGEQAEEGNSLARPIEPDFESLKALVTSTVSPTLWDVKGGPGAIQEYPDKLSLVVLQTKDVHQEIVELLAALRHLKRRQVSLDTYVIALGGSAAEGVTPRPLEEATILTATQAKTLLELASNDEDAKLYQTPKLTLLSGQTANLQLAESPFGELDLLLHGTLGKGSQVVRLRVAVNAKDKYDVLGSSDSLNVPGGQSVLLELTDEGAMAANGNGSLSSLIRGAHARKAAKSLDGKAVRRLILVTPRIVQDEEEEKLLGIPAR